MAKDEGPTNVSQALPQIEASNPTRSPDFRSLYVSNARGNMTKWEVHITLGVVEEVEPGNPRVVETVRLLMTKDFARALSDMLGETAEVYERVHGKSSVPMADDKAGPTGLPRPRTKSLK